MVFFSGANFCRDYFFAQTSKTSAVLKKVKIQSEQTPPTRP